MKAKENFVTNQRVFTTSRMLRLWVLPLLGLIGTGCLQVDTRVKVEMDGSATITERVRFSRRLLDLARMHKGGTSLEEHLSKPRVLARVKQMGKGAELVSHAVRHAEKGSRECVSVIKIPDLSDLRYVSPFLGQGNYPKHTVLTFKLRPCYKSPGYGLWPGQMYVAVSSGRSGDAPKGGTSPTPADLQVFRDLQPVFGDMLEGFRLRLVVESYAPIGMARGYYYYRGQMAATKEYDLIDLSSKNLDKHGFAFIENEEIMLELLRFQLSGGDLMATIRQHPKNMTVPVYHPNGIPAITFRPSRALFERHFKGKTLLFDKRRGGPRTANYKEIGLQAGEEKPQGKEKIKKKEGE